MDAITLLKNDHQEVENLFKAYEKLGSRAYKSKQKSVAGIIKALSVHAVIEEQVFYPAVRAEVAGANGEVLEAIEEHHIVKWVLNELEHLASDAENYDAKVSVLMENVRHHVKEEERDLFPEVRKALGRKRLAEVGDDLEAAKKLAPTSPHPRSPSTPPGNLVAAPVAKAVDTVRDTVRDKILGK
ncbi:MAG TPA: hemerythrin domain-containing protein [Frankiaceae bacterium]|jgi:hemerythrin superfamily protein|nr:hemerythrin domain-containing protein [Frankiaceae bacterium]